MNSENLSNTSTSLLDAVRDRQSPAWQSAWDRLVTLYHPLIYEWCRRWGLSENDALNVGQEVFLAISHGIDRFKKENPGDTFRGWVRRICRNKYVDWVRHNKQNPMATGGSDAQAALNEVPDLSSDEDLSLERQILYRQAIQLIESNYSARDFAAFHAVVVEERRPADVAKELNVDVNVVYLAKSRILARLREEFEEVIRESS